MYLQDIRITYMEPCLADPEKIRLKARFSRDIHELMPYLNAVIPHAVYNPENHTLTFTKEFRLLTVYPEEMTIAKALNTTDAFKTLDWFKDLVNDTYARRDQIEPLYTRRRRPTALEIYKYLPGKNCKQCGEPTCLAFAGKIFMGYRSLDECRLLAREEYTGLRETLRQLVAGG